MATHECKAVHVISPNQRFRQEQLLSLIAQICEPRHSRSSVDICRLVVDSRLSVCVQSNHIDLPRPF